MAFFSSALREKLKRSGIRTEHIEKGVIETGDGAKGHDDHRPEDPSGLAA